MEKSIRQSLMSISVLTGLLMTGCVDDAYDLEDINTDIEVKVNNLVVPINLDAITLSNAFDLDPESVIKEINGEYAVVVDGDFESSSVTIDPVTINPGSVDPISCSILKYEGSDVDLPIAPQTISYSVDEVNTSFSFSSYNVDKCIRSLKNAKVDWTIDLKVDISDNNGLFNSLSFQKMVLAVPAGLHISNYPYSDGKVNVGDVNMNIGRETTLQLKVDEIDFTKFDTQSFKFTAAPGDNNDGSISFSGAIGVVSGFVVGGANSTTSSMPQSVDLVIEPVMNVINVASVSGVIAYDLSGFDVADVELTDLPDMLHQEGTDISLANPQLYLSLNNPVANYGLKAASGLTLTSMKGIDAVNTCSLDPGKEIELGTQQGISGPYRYCLAPTDPKSYYQGYEGADFVGYKSLSQLLSGKGLPDYISVTFDNPRVLPGEVTDFALNTTIDNVRGNYTLFAPLELSVGSQIVYEGDETGWDDETVRNITITSLKVNAVVKNSLPADIVLSGIPLGVDGKPCVDPKTGKEVVLEGLTVAAGAEAAVELHSTGTVVGLDGIRYTAKCAVTEAGKVLKPAETIELKNIRVTVDGSYRDTL